MPVVSVRLSRTGVPHPAGKRRWAWPKRQAMGCLERRPRSVGALPAALTPVTHLIQTDRPFVASTRGIAVHGGPTSTPFLYLTDILCDACLRHVYTTQVCRDVLNRRAARAGRHYLTSA